MISNADSDCDPDSDDSSRLTAKSRVTQGSPERLSLSGSHGQRPWVYLVLSIWVLACTTNQRHRDRRIAMQFGGRRTSCGWEVQQ